MARSIGLFAATAWLAACATADLPVASPSVPRDVLVSGEALFGRPIAGDALLPEAILGIDDEMRAFVAEQIGDARDPRVKLVRLLNGMRARGLMSLDYLENATQTVRETFHLREGNCLSFTMLFVALAREASLDVSYQMVDIPPTWSSTSDVVTRNNHINTVVASGEPERYVIDFNTFGARGNYETREVSDSYALALFYNNVGASALVRRDYETSLVYFREAIDVDPSLAAPWNNLAVLYSRRGLTTEAESAYLEGLATDGDDPSLLTNLAILYEGTGNEELAERYRERVRHYRQRNPYYHYSLAREAYDARRFDEAVDRLRRAIQLKEDEHQFYFLRGLARHELGDRRRADEDFELARRYARFAEVRAQYDAQIAALDDG